MTNKVKEKSSLLEKVVYSLLATVAFIIFEKFILDNRPQIYKNHRAELLKHPKRISANTILDLDNNQHLISKFKGKPTILMFWATWCGYCARELPEVAQFYETNKSKINFLPLSLDDKPEDIKAFYKRYGGENLKPYMAPNSALKTSLEARGVPTFILVDEDSNAIAKFRPNWHSNEVFPLIKKLIEESKKS